VIYIMRVQENQHGDIAYVSENKHVASGDRQFCLAWSERSTVGHAVLTQGSSLYDLVASGKSGAKVLPCDLIDAGKFRHGAPRQWCKTHQCAFGVKADLERGRCSSADIPVEVLKYPPVFNGDLSVWFATKPAIFIGDRRRKFQEGIHVHQYDADGRKKIDATFPACILRTPQGLFAVTPTVARSRLMALISGTDQQDAQCPKCKHLHNDLGHFAEKPHKMHLCGTCGGMFWTETHTACNSLAALPTQLKERDCAPLLSLNSGEYSAIAIWATTPALYSTRPQTKDGFHVHAWAGSRKVVDDSFASVRLNGAYLDRDELLAAMLGKAEWNKKKLYQQEIVH
jgi:hypothetical protein